MHKYLSAFDRVGPLVTTWCMRMEAKNAYFKDVARISNFKNVPYSVAVRHQRLLCAHLQGSFFTYDDLESGPCECRNIVCAQHLCCIRATYVTCKLGMYWYTVMRKYVIILCTFQQKKF